jgi:hypothetical protein
MRRTNILAPPAGLDDGAPAAPSADHHRDRAEHLRTEFDFDLPRGYIGRDGTVHRHGRMRLATARDELVPLHDDRVRENPAYLSVVLLARVVTALGSLTEDDINVRVMEELFAADLAFLQDLYRRVNQEGHTRAAVTCPACEAVFSIDVAGGRLGDS